jgi:hypothetical protein
MLPKWDVGTERDASEFDAGYCGRRWKDVEEVHLSCYMIYIIDCRPEKRIFTCKLVRGSRPPH